MNGTDQQIGPDFFTRDPVTCARELIGCRFRWGACLTVVVETEAYAAVDDPACHTFSRKSAREFVARHPAGTAYVYFNYGMHWLFNVLVKAPEGDGFVLFRALEPLAGLECMRRRRGACGLAQLCSGPGRLTKALGIDGRAHGKAFLRKPSRGLLRPAADLTVIAGPRIGISRAVELPWRFRAANSPFVSRTPKD